MVALVTGASSGIGQATARRLAREPDARLVLVARREERLRELADEVGGATVIAVDVTDPGAPAQVAETIEREHGRLDLLVNNAGAIWRGSFAESGVETIDRNFELNFHAVTRMTEALLPLLRRSAPSAIVNVGSVAGRISRANVGAYSASKSALIGWSDSLFMEEAQNGVHVGIVQPGYVHSEGFPQDEMRANALGRLVVSTPEHVAKAIVAVAVGRKAERYVPRFWWGPAALRAVAPAVIRRGAAAAR